MKTDLGQIYSRRPLAHHSSITWPWQPCEIIKRKRIGLKQCLQHSGYTPCYSWTQTFLVQGIFNLFFFSSLFYNGYFWSEWIAYFDRKWDHYLASLQQCSRSVSLWVKKSPPVQISVCCFRGPTSYGAMKAMPSRHANHGGAQLSHSGGKMWVYFMLINFILSITGSHKIFPILTVTGRALFTCLGCKCGHSDLRKSAFLQGPSCICIARLSTSPPVGSSPASSHSW